MVVKLKRWWLKLHVNTWSHRTCGTIGSDYNSRLRHAILVDVYLIM